MEYHDPLPIPEDQPKAVLVSGAQTCERRARWNLSDFASLFTEAEDRSDEGVDTLHNWYQGTRKTALLPSLAPGSLSLRRSAGFLIRVLCNILGGRVP